MRVNGASTLSLLDLPRSNSTIATIEKLLPWTVATIGSTAAALALPGAAIMVAPAHVPWLTIPMSM